MTQAARWAWTVSLLAVIGIGLVLAFMLVADQRRGRASRAQPRVAVLAQRGGRGAAGAGDRVRGHAAVDAHAQRQVRQPLLIKLAGIFALMSVVPGVLIFTVERPVRVASNEAWFDSRVQGALDAGLELGRGTLDTLVTDLGDQDPHRRRAAGRGAPAADSRWRSSECASNCRAQEVALVGGGGQMLVTGRQQRPAHPKGPEPRCCGRRASNAWPAGSKAWTTRRRRCRPPSARVARRGAGAHHRPRPG